MTKNIQTYKSIKISTDDVFWERFQAIKCELGLSSDAEVVRVAITSYYKQYIEKKPETPQNKTKIGGEWIP